MTKLIKKRGLGGIAETVDKSLDSLGAWGKLGVQILDPTGITGWKDFGDSLRTFLKSGKVVDAAGMALTGLGVIPMVGLFKNIVKAPIKLLKKSSKTLGKDFTKFLLNSETSISKEIANKMSKIQKEEALNIIDTLIATIVLEASNLGMKQFTPEILSTILNLNKKAKILGGSPVELETIEKLLIDTSTNIG